MQVDANGTTLWFDVEGLAWTPQRDSLGRRPVVILVHGGPGSYDHSYFKPWFSRLAAIAQVVYLDLRGHGRSSRDTASRWSFELCADDLRAFCDTLGIARPLVYGHSMGGIVAMLYGARHPGHAAALILQSTLARFDLERIVDGFRRFGGDAVAALARRDYGGDPVSKEEWARVFAAFGPRVPDAAALARRIGNPDLANLGMDLFRQLSLVPMLARCVCPTLVCVGELDPVTPVEAAREIAAALPARLARLEVITATGHFPWLDAPDRYWPVIEAFVLASAS